MIYPSTQPSIIITIIGVLVIWHWFRKEKKEKKERELKKQRQEEESRRRTEKRRRKNEELDRERSAIHQSGMIPETVFLTPDEISKKEFCERKSGKEDITKDVIFLAWEALYNADKEERQHLASLPGERKGRTETVIVPLDKEDAKRMEYCRYSSIMKESDVYAFGLELYKRQI